MNTAQAVTADDADDGVAQRGVSAADGSPLHTAAASTVFNWRGPSTEAHQEPAGDIPCVTGCVREAGHYGKCVMATELQQPAHTAAAAAPPQPPEEEETMATRKKAGATRARKANKGGSPQLQICSALLQNDLSRQAIAEACSDLSAPQISSALNNSKSHGRIAFIESDQVYRITKDGKAWVASATGEPPPLRPRRRSAAPPAAARRTAARPGATADKATTPPPDEGGPTFRCGVMSDGAFFITKDEVSIELDADEHKQMLHYLERMAEPA